MICAGIVLFSIFWGSQSSGESCQPGSHAVWWTETMKPCYWWDPEKHGSKFFIAYHGLQMFAKSWLQWSKFRELDRRWAMKNWDRHRNLRRPCGGHPTAMALHNGTLLTCCTFAVEWRLLFGTVKTCQALCSALKISGRGSTIEYRWYHRILYILYIRYIR